MIIEADQDWGPFETLFRAYTTYVVRITTARGQGDATVMGAERAAVKVKLPSGKLKRIRYEDIEELLVY